MKNLIVVSLLYLLGFFTFVLIHAYAWSWIVATPVFYCSLLWISYSLCEGKLHGYYYAHHMVSSLKENFNEHPLFNFMRLCVLTPIFVLCGWKATLCLMAMQPFCHNGCFYYTRDILDHKYPKRWFAQSTSSTAWLTKFFTPTVRTISFLVGVILITIQICSS